MVRVEFLRSAAPEVYAVDDSEVTNVRIAYKDRRQTDVTVSVCACYSEMTILQVC
jgi:hypothetical protein